MYKLDERKIQSIGGSLFVSLPKSWAENMNIHRGDLIGFFLMKDGSVKIRPIAERSEGV